MGTLSGTTYSFQNQLSHSIACLDCDQNSVSSRLASRQKEPNHTGEVNVGEVEEQNFHLTAVVRVDDTGSSVDKILRRKAATRSNTTVLRISGQLINSNCSLQVPDQLTCALRDGNC